MQICNFFADSKSRAQELSNDVSFVIFGHQTWDLEGGGGQIDPPPAYPGFQVEIGLTPILKIVALRAQVHIYLENNQSFYQ